MTLKISSVLRGSIPLWFLVATACTGQKFEPIPKTGASLSGKVTFKNAALKAGLVVVEGAGSGSTGTINADGSYTVPNVPVGEVQIGVTTMAAKEEAMARAMSQQSSGGPNASPTKGGETVSIPDIPAKYMNPKESGFKMTVNAGENTFDIVIK